MNDRLQITWRWVWCVLGVLVAGCSGTNTPGTPAVTAYPTLIGYTRWPPTAQGPLRIVKTPSLTASPIGSLSVFSLAIGPPDCYEAATGALWCLGLVRNALTYAVEGITVRVSLLDSGGTALEQQEIPIARLVLWPEDESPYGALFAAVPGRYAGASVELIRARQSPEGARLARLGAAYDGETVTISNPLPRDATTIHAVVTLFDGAGRVIGFRSLDSDIPLMPGVPRRIPFVVSALGNAPIVRSHAAADGVILGAPLTPAPTG